MTEVITTDTNTPTTGSESMIYADHSCVPGVKAIFFQTGFLLLIKNTTHKKPGSDVILQKSHLVEK